jgi:hypothetical protein
MFFFSYVFFQVILFVISLRVQKALAQAKAVDLSQACEFQKLEPPKAGQKP